jgi:ribosomal-protein-alanine N-acetyltransferase
MHLNLPEVVLTQRLRLVRLRYEDAEEIFYSYASKPEATQYVSWPTHQSIDDTRRFLEFAVPSWDKGTDYSYGIRLKADNRLIGSFGIINESGRIQFGYTLSPSYWNKGYATEACSRMIGLLKTMKGIRRIGTFVDLDNVASMRVLLKSGLTQEGILQHWMKFPNQENKPKDCAVFILPGAKASEDPEGNTAGSATS